MKNDNSLIENINRLYTTEMGVGRIKRNLNIETDNVVDYCKKKIFNDPCRI